MSKVPKKALTIIIIMSASFATVYLLIQINFAYEEFLHWKSKEEFLEKKLNKLQTEAIEHRRFLDQLRTDPEFQDAVARKELGYGKRRITLSLSKRKRHSVITKSINHFCDKTLLIM